LWEEEIVNDFTEFEKRGLKHPQMAEIKALLAGQKAANVDAGAAKKEPAKAKKPTVFHPW
jgi:hypothetical protein